ncbi:angiotensin-converting enzyme-like isoform X2 [Euwallacea fornicatus]
MALLLRQSKFHCTNEPELCLIGQVDYHSTLNNERNLRNLKNTWQSWQKIFIFDNFTDNLELIKEAATLNEFESVQDYWEGLIDFSGAYQQAAEFWEEILPFYRKLQAFIRMRLFKFYNIENHGENIPSFLLGSDLGTDWSHIADVVLPHPQLHYDARSYLQYKDTKEVYEYSENIVTNLGLSGMTEKFWSNSNFNSRYCKTQFFEFCHSGYTEVSDCNKTSWSRYLDVHAATLKVAINDLDYTSLPRYHLRYCSIDDAVAKLGSILAVESLDYHGIVNAEAGDDSIKMTKLLLVALRIMPRLVYSLMVDKWRIEVLEQNSSNVADLWWKFRKEYMGVEGVDNVELEFLEDPKILSNQPYLSEFFGTLIAFQLMSYYAERSSNLQNIAMEFGQDETFRNLIHSRHTTDWPYLLTTYYGLDLSSSDLLKYFEPLERYFETVPLEQAAIVTTAKTTTTSSTTTTTTTVAPKIIRFETNLDKVVNDEPKVNVSTKNLQDDKLGNGYSTMYLGVVLVVFLSCVLVAAFTYKKIKKKVPPNNRRFDT